MWTFRLLIHGFFISYFIHIYDIRFACKLLDIQNPASFTIFIVSFCLYKVLPQSLTIAFNETKIIV